MTIDVIGAFALTALVVFNISAFLSSLAIPGADRLRLGVAIALWIGLQVALAAAGVFTRAVPVLGLAVILPPLAALVAFGRSAAFRSALLALPVRLLIGLNIGRIVGGFFVILAAQGRLGGPFPQSAGWGDLLTGLFAVPLVVAAASAGNRLSVGAWNLFGFLDLVAAGALGILSADGSPIQLIHAGAGSTAVLMLPWVVIPTVLVPFYLTVHLIVFAQLGQSDRVEIRPHAA